METPSNLRDPYHCRAAPYFAAEVREITLRSTTLANLVDLIQNFLGEIGICFSFAQFFNGSAAILFPGSPALFAKPR